MGIVIKLQSHASEHATTDIVIRREFGRQERKTSHVSLDSQRHAVLNTLYQRYLTDADTAGLMRAIAERYTMATLERLTTSESRLTRRASTLALGLVGGYESNRTMARRLHDADQGVRLLADNGIRELWCRDGGDHERLRLSVIIRRNLTQQYDEAVDLATELIHDAPWIAETWSQRSIGYYQLQQHERSANDCQQAIDINPFHFTAAVGMGHCYLAMHEPSAALVQFRRALRINPNLEAVRRQVTQLRKALEET